MKKIIIFAAFAAPLFFSCSKMMEKEAEETTPVAKIAFKASIEDLNAPTKADINASNQLVWSAGDKIGIFTNNSWTEKNQPFTLVSDGGLTTGGFAWDYGDFDVTTANIAFFPWQGTGSENNNVANGNMYFKYRDSYYGYTSGQMLTPLIAKVTRSGDAYNTISFKHAGAAVKVNVTNLPAWTHSIGLTVDGQQLNGSYMVVDPASVTNELEVGTNILTNDGEPDNTKSSVWLNFDPSASPRDFTFLFPIPKLAASSILKFYMYDKNGALVWSGGTKAKGDVAIDRGNVLVASLPSVTTYSSFDQISEWGVCGSHTGWADGSDTPMVKEVEGDVHIANNVVFEENAEFKIRKNGDWGQGEYGWNNLVNKDGFAQSGTNIKVLTAGTYDILVDTKKHEIRVVAGSEIAYPDAVGMPHHTSIKKATNLGATETANCYVITAPGNYKIPGVQGNSATTVGTIAGVELLWETYNNAEDVTLNSVIAAVDYDETDNCVYFKTPAVLKPGNALIAAKDGEGNIIWSWHIWIPATDIQEVGSYYVNANYLMDRNLGALNATVAGESVIDITSQGLYYQWGRKDPFVGPGKIDEGKWFGEGTIAGVARTAEKKQLSLSESIAQPTIFARGLYDGDTQINPDWCSDQNAEYWGDSGDKTIYDPCPAGYRVPKRDESKYLWAKSVPTEQYAYNASYYWFKIGDPEVVFPAAGWIDGGTVYSSCRFGIWNTRNDPWQDPTTLVSNYAAYARRLYSGTIDRSSVSKSLGLGVRCESISNSVPKPPVLGANGVTLATDGSISSDWSKAELVTESKGGIKEWKYGFDTDNLYFYFKIKRSSIYSEKDRLSFRKRRYIWMGFDTDNNPTEGVDPGHDLNITGCEARALVYPFTGTATALNSTEGTLEIINGLDDRSQTEVLVTPISTTEDNIYVYGNVTGDTSSDYAYIEMSVPKSGLGISSSFKGIMNVQFTLSGDTTNAAIIEIK